MYLPDIGTDHWLMASSVFVLERSSYPIQTDLHEIEADNENLRQAEMFK